MVDMVRWAWLGVALLGCGGASGAVATEPLPEASAPDGCVDQDRDGYCSSDDCCDTDPAVHPGAWFGKVQSACGGWDLNCDGKVEPWVEESMDCEARTEKCSWRPQHDLAWSGPVPACGEGGDLIVECRPWETSCEKHIAPIAHPVQTCR